MKLITAICLLVSVPVMASTSKEIKAKFAASSVLKDTLTQLEREHRTNCTGTGKISTFMPKLTKNVKFNAKCNGVDFKIEARFKDVKNPQFELETVKVWDSKILAEGDIILDDKDLAGDPFLKAYKNSKLVRDIRHFTEDSHKLVCDDGRVRKGIIGGKANYFYFTKCMSENKVVNLKIKAKVLVIGENFFAFDLTKYKLSFK